MNPRALLAACLALACRGEPDPTPWCSLARPDAAAPRPPTRSWWRDVQPLVAGRCVQCHQRDGIGPFALGRYDDARAHLDAIAREVSSGTMPPFLAATCCRPYRFDVSLTAAERAVVLDWIAQGAPEGDALDAGAPTPTPPPRLSRVDVTLRMPEAYLPEPPPGSTDDNRCFVIPWPLTGAAYVTGFEAVPGARRVVHHLVVGALAGADAEVAEARDRADPRPGFSCNDGLGGIRNVVTLGGSLVGSDFPGGIGHRVEPGARILLNIHYSTAHHGAVRDQTELRFRVDADARPFETLAVVNPAWLVEDAMRVRAGDPDAAFFYEFEPTVSTGGDPVWLWNVTPHMHEFATRQRVLVVREDGRRECLLEIPRWRFGWEQPYWFAAPVRFEPGDRLYLECRFDNSAANQPVPGSAPRDIAWGGNNQDMCSAFVAFTRAAP